MSESEPGPDEKDMLPADEVVDNFEEYIAALSAEIEMSIATIKALENGEMSVAELTDHLPDPSPMELWNRDEWRDRPDDYDETDLGLEGGDE